MAKPRRVSALSSVLKEAQEYNKVAQEDEQVVPVEQKTVNTEKQISVDTEIQQDVKADTQIPASTLVQTPVPTDTQKSVGTEIQKAVSTEPSERTHKQTIVISEDLAFRLKVHAAKHKETIASIATRAFEKLLAEEEHN